MLSNAVYWDDGGEQLTTHQQTKFKKEFSFSDPWDKEEKRREDDIPLA